MTNFLKSFIADESGASAAEYALIIAIVGVGIGAAALVLGQNVTQAVGDAANDVSDCNTAGDDYVYTEDAAGVDFTGGGCEDYGA